MYGAQAGQNIMAKGEACEIEEACHRVGLCLDASHSNSRVHLGRQTCFNHRELSTLTVDGSLAVQTTKPEMHGERLKTSSAQAQSQQRINSNNESNDINRRATAPQQWPTRYGHKECSTRLLCGGSAAAIGDGGSGHYPQTSHCMRLY